MNLASGKIRASQQGGVGWLVFDNPTKLNALSLDMVSDALTVMTAYDADPSVRVVVMRGSGEKAFISGGDISQFETTRFGADASKSAAQEPDRLRRVIADLSKPTIAMIHGYALGGGLAIALSADLRFASTTARLGIPAAQRGVAYAAEGLQKLVDVVGPSTAKDLMFSARRVSGDEALRIGLVNRVFEPGDLETETIAYAEQVAANAPLSVRAAKFFINQLAVAPDHRDHARMQAMTDEAADSQDFREATRAFMEKRKPVFRGS